MFKVSQSKVKLWRRCHYAYHLKYVEELRRKRKSRPLAFGTLVHQMIEADANGLDPFDVIDNIDVKQMKLFASEKEEYGDILNDVSVIMGEYFDHWADNSSMEYVEIGGKRAEHSFEIELQPGILWVGKIDAIGYSPDQDLRWLVEHKTFKRKPTDDDRWRNLQSVSYFRAIELLGWEPVDGTCWDYIWSKPPVKPQLLQNGSLSQKKIDTLPSVVAAAIKEYGLDRKAYRDYKKSTEANRSTWFQRVHTPVSTQVSELVFRDFVSTMVDMNNRHGECLDRNIERHCTWCDYEPLCRAALQGLDYDFIKEREYEPNSKPDEDDEVHRVGYEEN